TTITQKTSTIPADNTYIQALILLLSLYSNMEESLPYILDSSTHIITVLGMNLFVDKGEKTNIRVQIHLLIHRHLHYIKIDLKTSQQVMHSIHKCLSVFSTKICL